MALIWESIILFTAAVPWTTLRLNPSTCASHHGFYRCFVQRESHMSLYATWCHDILKHHKWWGWLAVALPRVVNHSVHHFLANDFYSGAKWNNACPNEWPLYAQHFGPLEASISWLRARRLPAASHLWCRLGLSAAPRPPGLRHGLGAVHEEQHENFPAKVVLQIDPKWYIHMSKRIVRKTQVVRYTIYGPPEYW